MAKWVSPIEKSSFLKWFLDNHQLKRKDARKILEYIIHHFHILENISFTEKIKTEEKTFVISSTNSDEPGFVYCHQQRRTEDISKALGDLMMNPTDKFSIIIHFNGSRLNYRYLQLIDRDLSTNIRRYEQYQRDAKETIALIDKVIMENEIDTLKLQIDAALDQNNKELFTLLTTKLKDHITKMNHK